MAQMMRWGQTTGVDRTVEENKVQMQRGNIAPNQGEETIQRGNIAPNRPFANS